MTSALEADDKPVDPSTMAKVVQRDRGNPDVVGEMHDAIASALVSPEDKKGATFLGENAHFLRTLFLEEDRVEAAMAHALTAQRKSQQLAAEMDSV